MRLTLLVLAAGMGSRFGGLKQVSPVNEFNETIIDYSVFDAKRAGFTKIVFVIRKEFELDFKEKITAKYHNQITVGFVFQDVKNLPNDFQNSERIKPWGTGHAIWCARHAIKENFAVINADDFYGYDSFLTMATYLKDLNPNDISKQCMVGYHLVNTLSENGSVSRGICTTDTNNNLTSITERTQIVSKNERIVFIENNQETLLAIDEITSMNMFGLTPVTLTTFESELQNFLTLNSTELKAEFYLPSVINHLISTKQSTVKVLPTQSKWFGMTYKEDQEIVVNNILQLTKAGEYPKQLWNG
ncbi:sugar phosphate nucleotidyltransferase [Tenacibaculum sp. 190524A02b]|uniref:UTP-glucose-1-phosphate uridylyltransferase n=1 Tax=Tenacibaculum vairaonense TaxID=3137860 RepID=A0ABP1FB35_9FLAO